MNALGAAVRDAEGHGINYTREELAAMEKVAADVVVNGGDSTASVAPQGFVPAGGTTTPPFWQYAIFGSGIGLSNIIIGPAPVGGGAREIIIGNASAFWQVLRRNSATGNYDQLFVSPVYSASIKRIARGNVLGDAREELTVMLADGRIYFYDLTTKAELGSINTAVNGLEGLSVTDLNGDGVAELIVTTLNDLRVFNSAGSLLWQLAGAGGYDVVAGQMDNDPAIEIAATSGKVTDAATHTAQWTRAGGFGSYLKLAPLPGAPYQQLIAAQGWDFVYAYDVATQLPRWSINVFDIDAIEIADVDNDGTPELIIGDGQWGTVHVHDLVTQAQKWETDNPEHGVTNIAVGDVDNDGVVDLLWGAGYTSSGSDYLYVASTTGTHAIKWQSIDLGGIVAADTDAFAHTSGDTDTHAHTCYADSDPDAYACYTNTNADPDPDTNTDPNSKCDAIFPDHQPLDPHGSSNRRECWHWRIHHHGNGSEARAPPSYRTVAGTIRCS